MWSGNINLENVYIKKSVFQKFKLPLTLRLGRIGKLKISVPWRSLSTSPVEIVIEGVNIIICKVIILIVNAGPKGKRSGS